MRCNELDQLRAAYADTSAWPAEARAHLAACRDCSRLQALLDGSPRADMPADLQTRIEAAILHDLRPVKPLAGVLPVTLVLLLCVLGVVFVANWELGAAGFRARSGMQGAINYSLLAVSIAALANLLARQMMPGSDRGLPLPLYFAAPLLAMLAADLTLFGNVPNPRFAHEALTCWEIGIVCAAVSAPLFWWVLRRGFSLAPVAHAGAAGLLAGLTGTTVLEIYCPYLDRAHISLAHLGAAITAVLVACALGRVTSSRAAAS